MADKTEAMVLQDGEGAYYAIPLDDVEAYRVADDKQDAVAEAWAPTRSRGSASSTPASPTRRRATSP